jgi:hypothetical protein
VAVALVTRAAGQDLSELMAEHSLPDDTRMRVKERLRPSPDPPPSMPRLQDGGVDPGSSWFLVGPWGRMLIVYEQVGELDTLFVTTLKDARRADAATSDDPRSSAV